ncbi:MAG: GNAT family N-acetyltransferase [archaeon]|nr:GNAT family N-acetyltransferase [archaeon]
MIYTLNKHIKWRKDKNNIFICDCKRLIDLKLELKFEDFMVKINKGIDPKELNEIDRLIFSDFKKLNLLSLLEIRPVKKNELLKSFEILDRNIRKRQRNNNFLLNKFKRFPNLFIGLFLNNEIIGIIFGFPREDYLLVSEVTVDNKFQKRGFGTKLINYFERIARENYYHKINVGARDNAINFYKHLDYTPSLLIQYLKKDYSVKDFHEMDIIHVKLDKEYQILDVKSNKTDLINLEHLRKIFPKAHFQYIFTKDI